MDMSEPASKQQTEKKIVRILLFWKGRNFRANKTESKKNKAKHKKGIKMECYPGRRKRQEDKSPLVEYWFLYGKGADDI